MNRRTRSLRRERCDVQDAMNHALGKVRDALGFEHVTANLDSCSRARIVGCHARSTGEVRIYRMTATRASRADPASVTRASRVGQLSVSARSWTPETTAPTSAFHANWALRILAR